MALMGTEEPPQTYEGEWVGVFIFWTSVGTGNLRSCCFFKIICVGAGSVYFLNLNLRSFCPFLLHVRLGAALQPPC